MQLRHFLFTAPITDCQIGAGGLCTIVIQLAQVTDSDGVAYCVGLVPESVTLKGAAADSDEKTIIWSLALPSPSVANAKFYFLGEKDHGIIVLSDTNKQLHDGRIGDGSGGPADPMKYRVKNKHKVKNAAAYVPIILQEDTVTGKIALCGTPDPTIRNDN